MIQSRDCDGLEDGAGRRSPLELLKQIDCGKTALDRANAIDTIKRPIVAMAVEYPEGGEGVAHAHRRGQLLYSVSGVMSVTTDDDSWFVPCHHVLWIPPRLVHQTRYLGPVQLRTLYLEPPPEIERIGGCRLFQISELLRVLIDEAMRIPVEYELDGRDRSLMDLVIHEIARMPASPLTAPLPRDPRLARICRDILRDPGSTHTIEHWTGVGGLSRRTLSRLFVRETGMSFTDWRQRVRLLEALVRITSGQSITAVAFDMGYESASAFSAMFRRNLGVPPTVYMRQASPRHD